MRVIVFILVVALLFGAIGLVFKALRWLVIIAVAVAVFGALAGYGRRT